MEKKRLLIYLALSFGLTWIYFFIFILSGFRWDSNSNMAQVVGLGMLFPFIANVLTRFITKEGFAMTGKDSLMLGISFKNKKWIYYILAVVLPFIAIEMSNIFLLVLHKEAFDANYYKQLDIPMTIVIIYPLAVMISTMMASVAALGEEGGWRGYMMPKLINIMGYKKAILVGGIIWGLWHAPLTCIGHNFGTDYVGFPYLGILFMCLFCTLMGIILTFLTIKTESIWPAAFMHAVNNGSPTILNFFINNEKIPNKFDLWWSLLIPTAIIAWICYLGDGVRGSFSKDSSHSKNQDINKE